MELPTLIDSQILAAAKRQVKLVLTA